MKVLVTGSSGFIGQELCKRLEALKHQVIRLVRRPPANDQEIQWDPLHGKLRAKSLENLDAIIHLAGQNVAGGLWTQNYKDKIMSSRSEATETLCQAILKCENKPKVFISSSGANFYGCKRAGLLKENAGSGGGFLSDVCQAWEKASEPLERNGIRRVIMRIGAVLDFEGGMIKKMKFPFTTGLGGNLGSGQQYLPWISRHDLIEAFIAPLENTKMRGVYNTVAPQLITNATFTKAFAETLKRPAKVPVPEFLLKLLPGEMAKNLFLCDLKLDSSKLQESGFTFKHSDINQCLTDLHKKT